MAPSLLPLMLLALSILRIQVSSMATSASDDFVMPVLGKRRKPNIRILYSHYNMYWLLEKRVKEALQETTSC